MKPKYVLTALIAAGLACTAPCGAASRNTAYTVVDLGPGPNGKDAYGYGESPGAQAGAYYDHSISCGKACSAKVYYPLAWTGAGSTPVVLLPQNYVEGWAYGAGGALIVGTLITDDGGYFGYSHAALWQGSSHTFTDLIPAGSCGSCQPGSNAYDTDGTYIAGSGGAQTLAGQGSRKRNRAGGAPRKAADRSGRRCGTPQRPPARADRTQYRRPRSRVDCAVDRRGDSFAPAWGTRRSVLIPYE